MIRFLCVLSLCAFAADAARADAPSAAPAEFDKIVLPFLNAHCVRCHGEKKDEGELRVDTLSRDFAGGGSAGHWGDIIERISAGEMPPEDEPQPTAEEAAKVVESLANLLKQGEA